LLPLFGGWAAVIGLKDLNHEAIGFVSRGGFRLNRIRSRQISRYPVNIDQILKREAPNNYSAVVSSLPLAAHIRY
jgi:hypothetical protein